jgi:HEAT repeat protein
VSKNESYGYYIRIAAAEILAKIGNTSAESLIASLKDNCALNQSMAAKALGKIGDANAVESFIAVYKDSFVSGSATETLVKIGKPAVEPLIAALKDEDIFVRRRAAEILGKIGDTRAVEPLIVALKDEVDANPLFREDIAFRQDVAEALGNMGDARAVEPLIPLLKDYHDVCDKAVEALGKIGDKRAVEPLIALLAGYYPSTRSNAAEALGKIGDQKAIPTLITSLKDLYSGGKAANALYELGWQPQSVEDKVYYAVAKRDTNTLIGMWEQTKSVLLKDVSSSELSNVRYALFAFMGIGRQEIIPELVETLNSKGNAIMAKAYLESGQQELESAARFWAQAHGYRIITQPPGVGPGGVVPGW